MRTACWLAAAALLLLCAGSAHAAVTCTPVELDNLRVFAFDGAYSSGGNSKTLNAASAALGAPQLACTYSGTPAGTITIEAVDAVTTSTVLASCTATASAGTATCATITIAARLPWIKLRARDTGGAHTASASKYAVGNIDSGQRRAN